MGGKEDSDEKKSYKRTELTVKPAGAPGLSDEDLVTCILQEEEMKAEMLEVIERNACLNDLEAYILGMRSHVAEGGKFAAYIAPADREPYLDLLAKSEDWLWDHMEDSKQVFIDKLAELKVIGGP